MNYHLTYRQATRKFGGVRRMRTMLEGIANRHGVRIFVVRQFNEEEEDDKMQDWANLLFFYDASTEKYRKDFIKAKEKVAKELYAKGLDFEYECCGDGDNEVIMSYRIVGG